MSRGKKRYQAYDDAKPAETAQDVEDDGDGIVLTIGSRDLSLPSVPTMATGVVVVGVPLVLFCFFAWLGAYDLGSCVTEAAALCFPVCLVLWVVACAMHAHHEGAGLLPARMTHLLYWVGLALFVVGEVIAIAQTVSGGSDPSVGLVNGITYGAAALAVCLQVASVVLEHHGFSTAEVAHRLHIAALVLSICVWWALAAVSLSVIAVLVMAVA